MLSALLLMLAQETAPASDSASEVARLVADWRAAVGIERWSVYEREVRPGEQAAAFRAQLAAEGEGSFLEEIVLYGETLSGNEPLQALELLIAGDDPRWIRAALWTLGSTDSHTVTQARLSLQKDPARLAAYVARHGLPAEPVARAWLQDSLAGQPAAAADASRDLAPLDEPQVFAHLLALPAEPAPGAHADPVAGGEDVHLRRELVGLAERARHPDPWPARVLELARGANASLARAALRALAGFRPEEVPVEALLALARDPAREGETRAQALLAASHGPEPRRVPELLDFAREPSGPTWDAAVERLGDLGDAFVLRELGALDSDRLEPAARERLERNLDRIRERGPEGPEQRLHAVRALLERAAWTDLACHRLEGTLVPWTLEHLRARRDEPGMLAALEQLAASYEPSPGLASGTLGGPELLGERVRDYARRLLR